MGDREVQHILMQVLYAALKGTEDTRSIKDRLTPNIIDSIYLLAKKHDLAHVVSSFVHNNKIDVDQQLLLKLRKEEYLSVYRNEQTNRAFKEICAVFEENDITYIPLKGSVLRPYYPYESMRTSCDIDLLVREGDLDLAISSLETIGYHCKKRNYHDVSLFSTNRVHLELHFSLHENMDSLDAVLKDAWEHAVPVAGAQYKFSDQFFAFHMFAHMAYHFTSGGCGIRSLLDISTMEHKMGISFLHAKELLEKAGIYNFAYEMSKLADLYFANGKTDTFSDLLLDYICRGGIYGSISNKIAAKKAKSNSSVLYVLSRLFLPYKSMCILYPFLKNHPYLLPFCWIARWIKTVFCGDKKQIFAEISYSSNVSSRTIADIKSLRNRLGI